MLETLTQVKGGLHHLKVLSAIHLSEVKEVVGETAHAFNFFFNIGQPFFFVG